MSFKFTIEERAKIEKLADILVRYSFTDAILLAVDEALEKRSGTDQ